ncbi:imidazole glycerol phosphate synthase subunit HisH [Helicobacter sp. 11S03491-1]|uniref:imidazole glycerol phosphate synthase subunit HisH n=1 Tax=Helicobacter sp. 11S03491-1 TaxID=1476196 RepID=UPI000BA7AF33|nr:imidazole glycerol phosphate synthase subunit HisH [Helicobacter sp. 11S03491-1]PAF41258.1 imidazole glycerol phosphate synthase, glutamine amidotransferase subunit [Helicobacter sp. 11S03491-1]
MPIAIIDYNIGNLASVKNALEVVGAKSSVESNPDRLLSYDKLILPGVGAFGDAIASLKTTGMKEAILEFVKSGKYILGICLGMQLLFEKSYEFGEYQGLGLIKGEVIKFETATSAIKIPHMGWNQCLITPKGEQHHLLKNIKQKAYLYFVHSYHVCCDNRDNILAECVYGYTFPAIIGKENILGLQPHPEKSHYDGLQILKNFATLP